MEPSKGGTVNQGDVPNQQKKTEMESICPGPFTSDQTKAASAQRNSELRATKPYPNDGSRCLHEYPYQTSPDESSSSASHAVQDRKSSTPESLASNEVNVPDPKELSDLADLRKASFKELTDALRRMGAETDDGWIKVDAQCLIEKLGEDDAKKLVSFFNKQSGSTDLVITEGVWGFNRRPATTDEWKREEIPEWCIHLLRKLVFRIYTTCTTAFEKWKDTCEVSCGILKETLNDMNTTEQRVNEIHAAAMDDIMEDIRREKAAQEMLQKAQPRGVVPAKTAQGNQEGELHCREETPNSGFTSQLREDFKRGTISGFLRYLSGNMPNITFEELEQLVVYMKSVGATSDAELNRMNEEELRECIGARKAKLVMRHCRAKSPASSGGKKTKDNAFKRL